MFTVTRSENNPILSPVPEHPWEAMAAFNGCPIVHNKKTHMVYRAISEPDPLKEPHISMSVIARAVSDNSVGGKSGHARFERSPRKVLIKPDADFDRFGCEDPRVTKIDDTFYIFYTALGGYPFSADNIKVAVALSPDLQKITEKHLVTPFNAKAMALFPEKINGKMAALLTINTDRKPSDICYAEFDKPKDMWSESYWKSWAASPDIHKVSLRRNDADQVELGAPPIKTEKGWLVVYSHIQNYGRDGQVFGIEIVLLDLVNPRRVVGRTKGAIMIPDAYYEKAGHVTNVIFPSGAMIRQEPSIKKDVLDIYYGAADTHCAIATIPLDNLLASLTESHPHTFSRFKGNPIIAPRQGLLWEGGGTLNPAAIDIGEKTYIIYRACTVTNISVLGYASTSDGFTIEERPEKPIYFPRTSFESHDGATSNYGCEDPRIVRIGDKLYMTYTAYDGVTPRVAVSYITIHDFLDKRWSAWSMPEVITPPNIPNKDATILPEPVNGKYMIIHRVNESICADFVSSLDFSKERVTECIEIINPRRGMWDGNKVGIAGPPIKTENGWLLLYHGVSVNRTYRVGAILLDLKDPTIVKARTAVPIFEPREAYEKNGIVANVVFPCSLVVRNGVAYIYYGAADSVIGVATINLESLLEMLTAPH